MSESGENDKPKRVVKKKNAKCDQNDNQYLPENIIVEVINTPKDKKESGDDSAVSRAEEDFTYSSFSCEILNKAVLASMEMGYSVDWLRVARFINHNSGAQAGDSDLEPNPDDEVSREMVARMREMFISMTVDRPWSVF